MTFYELLLTVHVLSIATWFGSGLAITVMGLLVLKRGLGPFSSFMTAAGQWAGRAHPAAGVLLLITGMGMVGDADLSIGEPWIVIALVGLVAAMGVGGALIGRTSGELMQAIGAGGGTLPEAKRPVADRLLLYTRIELAILALVIADMVIKPGG